MSSKDARLAEALSILADLGMPSAQRNDRSALCLLALLNLSPSKEWSQAEAPLMGITPMMDFARDAYERTYAPNTRETFRRQTMHQFVEAGIAVYNPDNPNRPVNSPKAVYQIEPQCLKVLHTFATEAYPLALKGFLSIRLTLAATYAKYREMQMVPLKVSEGQEVRLSVGEHSQLIKDIWTEFGPRYVPGGRLVYAGDTGEKMGYFDKDQLADLGVSVDSHGKMPDVVIFDPIREWLILAEAVTSHGPVDAKRHQELTTLFQKAKVGLVFVSAFPDRRTFTKYLEHISWETEVWIADNPSHLIHFNGIRFLGPYSKPDH